ncbi:AAA family ATPase [Methyloterricola oryzae]|uniref:AAA family ATPase n=1 Tax=Methyloterricola oryzae TaxID=1495050 RepID=UPI0005EB778B|nr:AAA family ATPase [Methyloterricola oryzae]
MERFTALMAEGGRTGKLDLLLHLLANLPRPILVLGPSGSGKTSLFRQVQSRALENWTTCYLAASQNFSLDWICTQMLEMLRPGPRSGPEATPEAQIEAELARLAKQNGRLILLLDDAGHLLPGLLGAICQFVRLHPEIQLAFALRPEDLPQKATSDPLALADAHVIEVSPWRPEQTQAAPPPHSPTPPRGPGFAQAFLTVFRPWSGGSARLAGPVVVTLLGAATVAGFVVQALWQPQSSQPPELREAAPPAPVTLSEQPASAREGAPLPTPSPVPSPSATPLAEPAAADMHPAASDAPAAQAPAGASPPPLPEVSASPAPTPVPPEPSASPAPTPAPPEPSASPVPTPAPSPVAAPAQSVEEQPFATLIATLPTNRTTAFGGLLDLWGITPPNASGDPCATAKTKALRCQGLRADWQTLQTYNRPAVLEIAQGNVRRYLLLTGMEGDQAVIDLNGRPVKTPMAEIKPYLRGEAIILWKPPFDKASIGTRERHEAARWIRERLQIPAAPGQELVYDEHVKAKVLAFQKQRGLLPDGRAGSLTLLQLQSLESDEQSPKLTTSPPAAAPAATAP